MPDPLGVFLKKGFPLVFADFLDHDLFGRLGCDSTQSLQVNLLAVDRGADVAVDPVDLDGDLFGRVVCTPRRGDHGRLEVEEHALFFDVLIATDRIHDAYQVGAHDPSFDLRSFDSSGSAGPGVSGHDGLILVFRPRRA